VRSAICQIAESSKFFMNPLFSGCANWPRLEKGKGKKRAAGVPTASVATAVELGDEEGGAKSRAKTSSRRISRPKDRVMGPLLGPPGQELLGHLGA
jgi:hypothetical protein